MLALFSEFWIYYRVAVLTLSISQISSPTIILERAGNYAWAHKSWRVREEFILTVATAVGLFASTELLMQRVLLSPVSLGIKMIYFSFISFACISETSLGMYADTIWLHRSCSWWMTRTKALEKLLYLALRLAGFISYIPASAEAFQPFFIHIPFKFVLSYVPTLILLNFPLVLSHICFLDRLNLSNTS
jgi:hypothetical protein